MFHISIWKIFAIVTVILKLKKDTYVRMAKRKLKYFLPVTESGQGLRNTEWVLQNYNSFIKYCPVYLTQSFTVQNKNIVTYFTTDVILDIKQKCPACSEPNNRRKCIIPYYVSLKEVWKTFFSKNDVRFVYNQLFINTPTATSSYRPHWLTWQRRISWRL